MRRLLAVLPLAAALVAAGVLVIGRASDEGPQAQSTPPKPPVVMVVFDEFPVDALRLPDGRIDAQRYPNFAALARTATWWPNATTVHDSTPLATPAVMDGVLPRPGVRANYGGHPRSIFTLLGERGYRIFSVEEASDVCPDRYCPGAARRRKGVLLNMAAGREARLDRWMRTIRRRRRPTFYFKHLLLPHIPWIYLPSGRKLVPTLRSLAQPRGFHDRGLTRHNEQRFLLQLGFVDRKLGELMARLRRTDQFDQALIAVAADHGIAFELGVKDRRKVTHGNVDEVAPVPFFVKAPGQREGRVERGYARTVDVVPTMADVLNVPLNWRADGRSAFSPAVRRRREVRMPTRLFTGVVRIGARELERRRRAVIRRRAGLYGTGSRSKLRFGSPFAATFRAGPHHRLVGRVLDRVRVARVGPTRARVFGAGLWRSVRPRSRVVPVQVAGAIIGGRRGEKRDLAVAVNGRIEATGRTFYFQGSAVENFSVVVPESSLRRGRNLVRVLQVAPQGLVPLGRAP